MGRLACGLTGLHGYGVWPYGVWLILGRIWLLGMYGLSGCPPMHPDVWAIHTKPYEACMAIWYGSSGMARLTQLPEGGEPYVG